jgi:hypothetical protein
LLLFIVVVVVVDDDDDDDDMRMRVMMPVLNPSSHVSLTCSNSRFSSFWILVLVIAV